MREPWLKRKSRPHGLMRFVAVVGFLLLWAAFLVDVGLWLFRLTGAYSSKMNLLSHTWSYISLGGALAGLLARGMPNRGRSIPTVWLLVSLAIVYGGQMWPRGPLPPPKGPTMRLLTLNLGRSQETRPRVISFLRSLQGLDFVFFQEVQGNSKVGDRPVFLKGLKSVFPHSVWQPEGADPGENYGLGILSRHPLFRTQMVMLPTGEEPAHLCSRMIALTAKARIGERVVRLINTHLCPPSVPWRNRRGHRIRVTRSSIRRWFSEMRSYEYIRRSQIGFLRQMAGSGLEPIILAGDMNTTPHSLDIHPLSRGLRDAFSEVGQGFGFTYYIGFLGERIDHVFHSDGLRAREAVVHDVSISDHLPVEVMMELDLL